MAVREIFNRKFLSCSFNQFDVSTIQLLDHTRSSKATKYSKSGFDWFSQHIKIGTKFYTNSLTQLWKHYRRQQCLNLFRNFSILYTKQKDAFIWIWSSVYYQQTLDLTNCLMQFCMCVHSLKIRKLKGACILIALGGFSCLGSTPHPAHPKSIFIALQVQQQE